MKAPPRGADESAAKAAAAPVTRSAPVTLVPPNELGQVLVLEYHHIGPREWRWGRTPANFRHDLETLYRSGFRAVSMQEYVTGSMDLPRGASPVVLTFDDSTAGQFRFVERAGKRVVDPECAVGILEEFCHRHPDFGQKATFYVLPSAFEQPRYAKEKLRYLSERGFELGNHTYGHHNLRKLSGARVQEELARAQQMVQEAVPGYRFLSLALPLGISPRDSSLARQGSWNGVRYSHQAVLLVGSTPAPSPWSRDFNPFRIPRVQATDMVEEPYRLSTQLKSLLNSRRRRHVSDGDPGVVTVPAALADDVESPRLHGKRLNIVQNP